MNNEHAVSDFVCHTHQTLASECGCLEIERRRCCPRCGLTYMVLSGQYYCPTCEYDEAKRLNELAPADNLPW